MERLVYLWTVDINAIGSYLFIFTVKPVLRGHLWNKVRVVFKDRLLLKRGSIHIKISMTGQEKGDL